MKQIRTLHEATNVFLDYSPQDMKGKYQLDRMRKLLALLDNPQEKLKIIHIAGTSGKTSTAYFIRGMLEATGSSTGLTVSPHIVAINERVQINGRPLDEPRFLAHVNHFFTLVTETHLQPTYFELLIALAYWIFAREKVDYAVIETGMGGLLDGTNVVSRSDKVCVITDIGLDHTEILGDTLSKIAAQKAGIIKLHNHVFVRSQSNDIMRVIADTAKENQATLEVVTTEQAPSKLPAFQRHNWALAKTAFEYVVTRDNLPMPTNDTLETTVALQTPPGRWEVYTYNEKTVILDGAHNPQKLEALCQSLTETGIRSAAVLANLIQAPETKIISSLTTLQPFVSHLIVPEFKAGQTLKSKHSLPLRQLVHYAQGCGITSIETCPELESALQALLKRPEKILVITGSLYLISAVRPLVVRTPNVHKA